MVTRSSDGAAWFVAALTLLTTAGCSRGPLPELGFGSASGESEGASSSDGPALTTNDPPSWSETLPGDGDPSASDESASSTLTSSSTDPGDGDPGDGDPSGPGDKDGDDSDSWGIPPDVTNEPCDPLAQDCFETHKCVPFATDPDSTFWDANKCMPILGDKGWGEPCTLSSFHEAQDDCDGEGFCWNLEWSQGQLHGTCVPFCVGSPQDLMCPPGWGCLFSGAIALCSKQCNPLAQDCPQDYGCYWTGGAFDCLLTSNPAGPKQPCEMNNDCLPGLACVAKALVPGCGGIEPSCCTQWCDIDAPDICEAPLSCVAFFEPNEAPPMLADVGLCVQP